MKDVKGSVKKNMCQPEIYVYDCNTVYNIYRNIRMTVQIHIYIYFFFNDVFKSLNSEHKRKVFILVWCERIALTSERQQSI